ncbi:putative tRNA (uracil-O(2)-)-methyltransferase [Dirofilaria immitis]
MDCTKIATAPLSASLEYDIREAFSKVIDIWKERCHTVNRRLLGHPKFFQLLHMKFLFEKYAVEFRPCVLDDKRHPHVSFPYRLALEKVSDHQWNLSLFVLNSETNYAWLREIAFPRLLKWFSEINKRSSTTVSHRLVNMEDYSQFYCEIKNKWGQHIASTWTERTNPQKFVYEDCAIAAYLIAYWRQKRFLPRSFCDIGCGNGLLVYLLQKMKINGYGIDLRQRRIWKKFVGTDLREKTLNPIEDLLSDSDFLIGNHTDELTPWIPIMAARSSSNFFLLPCCPFDFYSRFQKKCGMATASVYSSYLLFIRDICLRLGYCVEEDRLKIPSMKRHCFLCTVPASGLVENVENIINNMLAYTNFRHFVPREKVERVKNCSQLSWDFRQLLTTKIFRHLFELPSDKSTMNIYWRCGQSCPLKEIANLLNEEEKAQLRDSDGGLQTFLKNQHQVFKVVKGTVSIRNWAEEGKRSVGRKLRTSDCWFYKYHSGGCPLSAEDCSYKH